MRSTRIGLALALSGFTSGARAQQQAQGFAVERLYPSAPGAGFIVLDELSQEGGLGGAVSLTLSHAHLPLSIHSADGAQSLAVVRHETLAGIGLAATWGRFRLHARFESPLYLAGQGGQVDGWQFRGPVVNVEQNPDALLDPRLGFEARLLGEPAGPLRVGASAELIFPSGDRADYLTDDTYRGRVRLLFAGDAGRIVWAGHAGVHLRPLSDGAVLGSPRGSELIFGLGAGTRLPVLGGSLVVGPEIFGATALSAFGAAETTALEALLGARLERFGAGSLALVVGAGAGIHARFGAPQWRALLGVELSGRAGQ